MTKRSKNVWDNHRFTYDSKERFSSYWHQIHEIITLRPRTILEIGIGYGFTSSYLKKSGIEVYTLDINKEFLPNVQGNILYLPFQDNSFNVVACFEMLEHSPFSTFSKALQELKRVSTTYILVSIPDISHSFGFSLRIPQVGTVKKLFQVPFITVHPTKYKKEHDWEIGRKRYPLSKITATIKKQGLEICHMYRIFENPHHRVFLLKKGQI
jgi:ubiquinone/menaquinone biosynthesis C-methylase UbiE